MISRRLLLKLPCSFKGRGDHHFLLSSATLKKPEQGVLVGLGGLSGCSSSCLYPFGARQRCGYMGEAKMAPPPKLSPQEERLLEIARPRSEQILADHFRLPTLDKIPMSSLDDYRNSSNHSSTSDIQMNLDNENEEDLALSIRRKRLVYRSKQRGWLEVDLLLGTWASENVSRLNEMELDQFEAFVNLETVDIYQIITLRSEIPESMQTPTGDGIVEQIQQWVKSNPLGRADPIMYRQVKMQSNLI